MSEVASISRYGKMEPFDLQVARGQVAWHRPVIVFGFNNDVDTASETVWPGGGILDFPAAALQMSVSSSNANDTANGTGARSVYIGGLDSNHDEISEIVVLNGQSAVTTQKSYLPKKAREALTPSEYAATTKAKREGTKRGQQFVKQPKKIAAKTARFR